MLLNTTAGVKCCCHFGYDEKHVNFKKTPGVSLKKKVDCRLLLVLLKSCVYNCPFFFNEWFHCSVSLKDTSIATKSNLVTHLCYSNVRIGINWSMAVTSLLLKFGIVVLVVETRIVQLLP